MEIPGLLIIDTPGHESFSNLRSRGSSLCDLAIVVIDLMHSLENQTKESIQMLREKNIPFVVALNKIDRCHGWVSSPDQSSYLSLKNQNRISQSSYNEKYNIVYADLIKMYLNSKNYWENNEDSDYINIIPTSAITGEGMPDLLGVICQTSQN